MRTAGAPIGNQNAAKGRRFAAIAERVAAEKKYKQLEGAVIALFDKASNGDLKAIEIVRDTFDGKPAQAITGADGGPLQVQDVPWLGDRKLARR